MGLFVIAQALQAFLRVVEEHFRHDISATASELCTFERFCGLDLQVFIAMPLTIIMPESAGEGLFDHTIESFQMVFGSWKLVGIMAYSLYITGLNITGMIVTALSIAISTRHSDPLPFESCPSSSTRLSRTAAPASTSTTDPSSRHSDSSSPFSGRSCHGRDKR
jgi:hypothetical protein